MDEYIKDLDKFEEDEVNSAPLFNNTVKYIKDSPIEDEDTVRLYNENKKNGFSFDEVIKLYGKNVEI